jgi:hypothetical protein
MGDAWEKAVQGAVKDRSGFVFGFGGGGSGAPADMPVIECPCGAGLVSSREHVLTARTERNNGRQFLAHCFQQLVAAAAIAAAFAVAAAARPLFSCQ